MAAAAAARKVLVIVAHPNVGKSFNHRAVARMREFLESKGDEVKVVDLYESKFLAPGGPEDVTDRLTMESFDYQAEQKHAVETGTFSPEIKEQMDLLTWCDTCIFQYPLYWFSVPSVLKAYIDRVYAYYFSYGGGASLAGRKVLHSITTGGPASMYEEGGMWGSIDALLAPLKCTAKLIQMEFLEPIVNYGVNFTPDEGKEEMLDKLGAELEKRL
jgi:NAD(P)H dehydrogenase (quinone)